MRQQRLNQLLELISQRGHVSIGDAQEELGISAATARRDIAELAEQRLITRIHGGASALGSSYELPLQYKIARQADAKLAIARTTAGLVEAGQTLAVNGGTTTTEVARAIGRRPDLSADDSITVVTNALNIAYELSIRPNVSIVVTGGSARSQSYELVGPLGDRVLDLINVETAILGVDGLAEEGLSTLHPLEAKVSERFIAAASKVIVVADATKLGTTAFAKIGALDDIDAVVTDGPVPSPLDDALRGAGVDVVVAESPSPATNGS